MKAIGYALSEALVNLRRNLRSAAMSLGTIAVAFLTLGLFLLIAANLQRLVDGWTSAAEMSIYFRDDADESMRQALATELNAHAAVAAVEYVSKEQALARFKSDFPELADLAQGGSENPFPSSLEVRLRPDPASTAAAEGMAQALGSRTGVADVRYDREWLARVLALVTGVRVAGLAIAAVLVLGASFTVMAVVRLSLQARLEELDIMQLVGAPLGFIRGPSIAEGTLLGGIGAVVSLGVLWLLLSTIRERLSEVLSGFTGIGEIRFLSPAESALLVLAGLAAGGLAGWVASRSIR